MEGSDASTLHAIARQQGMITLFEDGLRKVVTGLTSLEEVLRVTQDQIESDQSTTDEESAQIPSASISIS